MLFVTWGLGLRIQNKLDNSKAAKGHVEDPGRLVLGGGVSLCYVTGWDEKTLDGVGHV